MTEGTTPSRLSAAEFGSHLCGSSDAACCGLIALPTGQEGEVNGPRNKRSLMENIRATQPVLNVSVTGRLDPQ